MNGLPGAKQAAFTGDTESENQSRFGLTKDIIDRQNKLRELRENLRKKKEEEDDWWHSQTAVTVLQDIN